MVTNDYTQIGCYLSSENDHKQIRSIEVPPLRDGEPVEVGVEVIGHPIGKPGNPKERLAVQVLRGDHPCFDTLGSEVHNLRESVENRDIHNSGLASAEEGFKSPHSARGSAHLLRRSSRSENDRVVSDRFELLLD